MYYATASKIVKVEDGVGSTLKHFLLEIDTSMVSIAREEAKDWAKREGLALDSVRKFNNGYYNKSSKKNNIEFSEEYYNSMRGTK